MIPINPLYALLAAAVLVGAIQTWRLDSAQEKIASYEVAVEQCGVTNERNGETITDLIVKSESCIAGREADERVFAEVRTRWDLEKSYLEEKAEATNQQRIEVYRDPTCAEFAKMDIRAMCPSLADSLWRQAQNYHRVRNEGSAGSGEGSGS